tara:strand:+ start:362 stop:589 length:228 start_codon:yes stop_codon:yes gene_type:complete
MSDCILKDLGKHIAKLRAKEGITQRELADRIEKMTQDNIHRYELGKADMRVSTLYALAEALGVSARTLVTHRNAP